MRYSQLIWKTLRQPPKEAETVNHQLLTQAGFVDQLMAGVYSYLPLGLRTLNKIENIVREEMDALGSQEILMPILHPKSIWEKTGGWDKIDVLFKIQSRTGKEYALGQSEEEVVTPLVLSRINSYKDLPVSTYQIHWKYRDELRAKSGILRGREFYMKDMYSFHENQEDFQNYYDLVKKAYLRIYERLGLTAKVTEASGGSFSEKISYEFMVLTEAGEDNIFYCPACDYCINEQIAQNKEGGTCPKCGQNLQAARASEVGNVFDLGQKYGQDFDLTFLGQDGKKHFPVMGCYGLGISRVMGVIVEKFHDDKGIIWPKDVAPFQVHLVEVRSQKQEVRELVKEVYRKLQSYNIEVLYDDREEISAGQKFADADLIGIPVRLVVSERSGDRVEWKERSKEEAELLNVDEVINRLIK